jgi:hypothetical protein
VNGLARDAGGSVHVLESTGNYHLEGQQGDHIGLGEFLPFGQLLTYICTLFVQLLTNNGSM